MRKLREMGDGYYGLREVKRSRNMIGFKIGSFIIGQGFWESWKMEHLGLTVLGLKNFWK